jgi:hypothetical protein
MTHDVEQQLLKFLDLDSDSAARFPPSVRIEVRVTRGPNSNRRFVVFHGAIQDSAQTSGVV